MPQEKNRIVWSVFQTQPVRPEEALNLQIDLFYPTPAEEGRFETQSEALQRCAELMKHESWEVGVVVLPTDPPKPWQVCWLEPAGPIERRQVAEETLPGYRWDRARPPRGDEEQALFELEQLWKGSQGRRAYAVEREVMDLAEITRHKLHFRERNVY